jgi:hypothetical protein
MSKRLGFLTGSGLISAIITLALVGGFVFAQGEQLFSPGPLSKVSGIPLGGVTSHAEIAGNCSLCHADPLEVSSMSEHCVKCHVDVAIQQQDPASLHGALFKNNTGLSCRTCHPEHNGPTAPITALEKINFPHDSFGFSLKAHKGGFLQAATGCTECHGNDFTKVDPVVCGTCHMVKAAASGKDAAFTQTHLSSFGLNCLACHDGLDTYGKSFDHSQVPFSLIGKHVGLACSQCHVNQQSKSEMQATRQNCVDCHLKDESHAGSLGTNCGVCHSAEGWKPAKFDHNQANFKLLGKHVSVDCKSCHLDNNFSKTPKVCSGCHTKDDPHQGRFGTNCATCHTVDGWKPASFDHNLAVFKLSGKHVGVACENCHANGIYKGTPSDCNTCHVKVDKHKGTLGTNCATCHTTSGWLPATFDHSLSAFKLTGSHLNVQCANCHINGVYKGTPTTCYACHAAKDKHKGSFGTDCSTCHSTSAWLPATFNHSLSAFKLTGAHLNAQCATCHINGVYKGTPSTCYACHASNDKHKGAFGTSCSTCHTTSAWLPATFDHTLSIFKLTGKHISVSCASCHPGGVYKGTPTTCYACHASNDKHSGSFGTNCASCHTTSGWLPATFDHSLSAFKLTGKHVSVSCANCHKNGVYKGTPTTCNACHASSDAHGGAYGSNCASCHTTSGWLPATFDHSLSAFKLTGKHVSVSCANCHKNGVYKGTPSTCYACHASSDAHGGAYGTNCASCHTTSGWQSASFDHSLASFKLTGAHLNVQCTNCHVNGVYKGTPTACSSCHSEPAFHAGALGTNCAQCHTTSNWSGSYSNHPKYNGIQPVDHKHATCKDCHTVNVSTFTCRKCHDSDNPHD